MKRLVTALLLLLLLAGCAAQPQMPPAPAETPPAPVETPPAPAKEPSPVYADWSKLTPYEPAKEICSYHPGYRADGVFEPRGDYGALLPYIGKYSAMDQYVIDALPLYGLVTDKGELVSEPVYAIINFLDDFFMLYRGDPAGFGGGDTYLGGSFSRTLAAADGSWAHELGDRYYAGNGCGLLMTASADRSLDLWNRDGEIVMHFDGTAFTPWFGEDFHWGEEGGPFIDWTDDRVGYAGSYLVNGEYRDDALRLYLDFETGAVTDEPPAGYPAEIDYAALEAGSPVPPDIEGCTYAEPITDPITGETYFYGFCPGDGESAWHYSLFDGDGALLVEDTNMWRFETPVVVRAGLCSTVEDGFFCYRSLKDGALVFRCLMRTNSD